MNIINTDILEKTEQDLANEFISCNEIGGVVIISVIIGIIIFLIFFISL